MIPFEAYYDADSFKIKSRFMVDYDTWTKMHPEAVSHDFEDFQNLQRPEDTSIEVAEVSEPPDDEFIMCLPSKMKGFDMDRKQWSMFPKIFCDDSKVVLLTNMQRL